jgi:hypothetical protein
VTSAASATGIKEKKHKIEMKTGMNRRREAEYGHTNPVKIYFAMALLLDLPRKAQPPGRVLLLPGSPAIQDQPKAESSKPMANFFNGIS